MLLHPHTLNLIVQYKQTNDDAIFKEILSLLLDSEPVYAKEKLYEIIYSHIKTETTKKQNLEHLNNYIDTHFDIVEKECSTGKNLLFELKNFEGISAEAIKLVKKRRKNIQRRENSKRKKLSQSKDSVTENESYDENFVTKFKEIENLLANLQNSDQIMIYENKEMVFGCVNKIIAIFSSLYEKSRIPKKEYAAIVNSIKLAMKPPTSVVDSSANLSLLNFVTKEKKKTVSVDSKKRFEPIDFDSSVYVYKLNNPNFESLRRRKDLVNPVKMMFIKFSEDIRPPIYKQTGNKANHKISYEKIFKDIDYDEESTWEDDPDAESIDSEESEEEDSSSGVMEFVEADSGEQEKKRIKKPNLTFPTVKIEINNEYDPLFKNLPIRPTKDIPEFIKDKLKLEFNNTPAILKRLSRKYMIVESTLKEYLEKECPEKERLEN
ncbi:hypothetical protein NGRA_1803 [Nosema granulosis]|uniref:Uncharacterized protein n=1 Tax=Nosema granulosis TaxID=83296 RepID=A0A9P6GYA1_9MICR|nr:hypothetical protein NGRA_1803 [Nosema granulosis]